MRANVRVQATVIALLLLVAPAASAAPGVTVAVDRTAIQPALGHTFAFSSTITNHDRAPASGLIAHLNVLSLRGDVYVDPEDWSSHRTRYLQPIPAGGSTTLTWNLDAVNAGHLGVYVAVLPRDQAATRPATSPLLDVTVTQRRTLDSGGIVPLALGIPTLLGLIALAVRLGRGRPRRPPRTRSANLPH